MRSEYEIMKVQNIEKVNEAIFTLRHFIELSSKLLPYLYELSILNNPTTEEEIHKSKIVDVYENYSFDTITSRVIMHSDILDAIQLTFRSIIKKKDHSKTMLDEFLNEYQRLLKNWSLIDAN